ncbi:MAG: nicotinate (nicotinamide) nucleotide adenylyltransferase [Campylobacterota bacterium]|nr:nicotinate (nicotinamide) nucleotide adenylyltransferase [Campylobacterota bacterium]
MKTIALFGGSFDPPHIGHEAIVKALSKLTYIEKIVLMPTFLNPFKETSFAPAQKRLEWLKEIFASVEKVDVSSYEVFKNKKVPTIETVNHLLKTYKKVYLVIGADNLANLESWHRYDELKKRVTFIVASRDEIVVPECFIKLKVDVAISSSSLREKMDSKYLPKTETREIIKHYKENNE